MDNTISPLVTIIIPCYNMESKIARMLDSVLNQTYQRLHVVIIDDGSIDRSKEIVFAFESKFKSKNIEFEYIYKENGGLGSAINTGLKYIKGDYFCWPDADDWLSVDSIEKRVSFLEQHEDYGLVRSDAAVYKEDDLCKPVGTITKKRPLRFKETSLFEDYILERYVIFCPGCHMVRTSAFKEVYPQMEIFEGNMGQNYQMLLPLVYNYKFGYIDECLYNYVIYNGSMSHSAEWFVNSFDCHQEILLETLKRIKMSNQERNYYIELVKQKYIILKCIAALSYGKKSDFRNSYKMLNKKYFYLFGITTYIRFMISKICYMIPGAFLIGKIIISKYK